MRLGIFGGTFDPVHYGHLLLAECCREQCRLDQVWFLPVAIAPHKQRAESAPAQVRVEMLQLAVSGDDAMIVSKLEIDRGGVSYTADSLDAVRKQQPDAELFLLMGADSLHDLPNWYEPERICRLAIPVAVGRFGTPEPDFDAIAGVATPERLEEIRRHRVQMPLIGLSSTELRRRIAAGSGIRFRTPRAVEKYIETHRVYQDLGASG